MNSRPMISCTMVRKNGRSSGDLMPGTLATATPIAIAAISPVSSRRALHAAATATTVAMVASVASTPCSSSLSSSSHSTTVPTTPPRRPIPTLAGTRAARRRSKADVGAERLEHERPDDRADGVDGRALPPEDRRQSTARAGPLEQRSNDGRAGHDEDRAEHHRRPRGESEQQPCQQSGAGPRDRHAPQDQPSHDALAVTLELPER